MARLEPQASIFIPSTAAQRHLGWYLESTDRTCRRTALRCMSTT